MTSTTTEVGGKYETTHELKTWPAWFEDVVDGVKTFEIRRADRRFLPGHVLLLREWDPQAKEIEIRHLTAGEVQARLVELYAERDAWRPLHEVEDEIGSYEFLAGAEEAQP